MYSISSAGSRKFSGVKTAPIFAQAYTERVISEPLCSTVATRSPFSTPNSSSEFANRLTRSLNSR
jgi:hypothetical protein